ERDSASMKSHQFVRSYSTSRRSSHDVRNCHIFAAKKKPSSSATPTCPERAAMTAKTSIFTSSEVRGNSDGRTYDGLSNEAILSSVVPTRLSATQPPLYGMRAIVSTM